jgi:hypothetical protein
MILKGQRKALEIPVTLVIPADPVEGSAESEIRFHLFVRNYGISKRQEFQQYFHADKKKRDIQDIDDIEFVREHCLGWKGIQDADSNEVEFSSENIPLVLDDPDYRKAIVLAIIRTIILGDEGLAKAVEGN